MKKYISRLVAVCMMVAAVLTPLALPASNAGAVDLYPACNGKSSTVCNSAKNDEAGKLVKSVVNVLLYVLGSIAVIMIIVGGIRYTLSHGSSTEISGAKDTILYAVIGLIVAMLAWSIVNFVIGMF